MKKLTTLKLASVNDLVGVLFKELYKNFCAGGANFDSEFVKISLPGIRH